MNMTQIGRRGLLLMGLMMPFVGALAQSDEEVAKRFLDIWLDAQNRGDFQQYSVLYGRGFSGVRKSGNQTVRMDRAGWLKDRARMFKSPMKVEISDVVVEPVDGGMLIHLTQRFQQGTYRDVGPKELYLAMEGNGYRVFGERMLSSTLLKSAPAGGDGIVAVPKDASSWLVGRWEVRTARNAEDLVFNRDGTFRSENGRGRSGSEWIKEDPYRGRWALRGNELVMKYSGIESQSRVRRIDANSVEVVEEGNVPVIWRRAK